MERVGLLTSRVESVWVKKMSIYQNRTKPIR